MRFLAVGNRLGLRIEFQNCLRAIGDLAEMNQSSRAMSNVGVRFGWLAVDKTVLVPITANSYSALAIGWILFLFPIPVGIR